MSTNKTIWNQNLEKEFFTENESYKCTGNCVRICVIHFFILYEQELI